MSGMSFSHLNFGSFSFKIYGILVAIAFFVAAWHFYKQAQKQNFSIEFFLHHFWRWVLGALILGRLVAMAMNPEVFSQYGLFSFFAFWVGEIHFVGAGLGFFGAMFFDFKKHDAHFFRWVDLAIPSMLIGVLIVDVAAFLTGASHGKETDMFWGVQYETVGVEILNPVHPVPLYALAFHVWLLLWAQRNQERMSKWPGKLAVDAGILFILADLVLQVLRGDETMMLGVFRVEQVLELGLLIVLFWISKYLSSTRS